MLGCCEPGSRVWLSESDRVTRKYRHTWEIVEVGRVMVGINTGLPNALVAEAIGADAIPELAGYAREMGVADPRPHDGPRSIAMTMRLRTDGGELAFITMIATFGTALDITLTELALETFLPADASTAAALHLRFGGGHSGAPG